MVYVDDIIVCNDQMNTIQNIKHTSNELFRIKDLGEAKFFMLMEVARTKSGIVLS